MKKSTLLLGAAMMALSASAQFRTDLPRLTTVPAQQAIRPGKVLPNVYGNAAEAAKTTAVVPRWYNHAEALGTSVNANPYDETLNSLNIIWPDSTVRFTNTAGTGPSTTGINWLSYGEVFSPVSSLWNGLNANNRGKLRVTNSDSYRIDSLMLRGLYSRTRNTYTDSMIIVVIAENAGAKFAYFNYRSSPDIAANHGVDSFAALLYSNPAYQKFVTQVGYRSGTTAPFLDADTFRIGLNQATFVDSLADGTHQLKIGFPGGIQVAAGGLVSMTATFKPGTTWTSGTAISDYNFWAFMSHEVPTQDGFVFYPVGDRNMSYTAFKDSSNAQINATLSIYQPSITWTAPFGAEVHNVSWKVSCTSCINVGVADVATGLNIGDAYPNPARTNVTIPVTVKNAASVSVSLSNAIGQVVARQTLNATAGQTQNAVFNTASLANGIYIYTVESNGERATSRIVVAH